MSNSAGFCKRLIPLSLLLPPVLETAAIRYFAHRAIGENISVLGIHATDIYVPLLAGVIACLWMIQGKSPLRLGPRPIGLLVNGILFVGSLVYFAQFESLNRSLGPDWASFWGLLLVILTLPTSFFLFLSFTDSLRRVRPHGTRLFCVAAAIELLLAYPLALRVAWKPLAWLTANAVYWVLRFSQIEVRPPMVGRTIRLWHPNFSVTMTQGCSGLEGLFFFLFALVLLGGFDTRVFSARTLLWLPPAGLVLMFLLNILRISLFFGVALFIEQHVGGQNGRLFYEYVFHANLGWMLYLAGVWWLLGRFWVRPGHAPIVRP